MNFSDIDTELITLLKNSLSSLLNEIIEARGELVHAIPQVGEAKVNGGQLICYGRRIVQGRAHHAGAERRLEGGHFEVIGLYALYWEGLQCDVVVSDKLVLMDGLFGSVAWSVGWVNTGAAQGLAEDAHVSRRCGTSAEHFPSKPARVDLHFHFHFCATYNYGESEKADFKF